MYPDELEASLKRLGEQWPAPSVADAVVARLHSVERAPPRAARTNTRTKRWGAILGLPAVALAVWALAWLALVSRPSTLFAQVEAAIRNAKSVHVQITAIDRQGQRFPADLWYVREHGLRAESPDQIVVDDGRQQWSWKPGTPDAERLVVRRASRDAVGFIATALQLADAPADWTQSRAPTWDREVAGERCVAHQIEPPATATSIAYGDRHPSRMRFIAWLDGKSRVVRVEEQRQMGDSWQSRREIQVQYDVEVAVDKFRVQFPATTNIVDGDRRWESQYPLEKALTTTRVGGLLFAVHEVIPCEDEMFMIVSSVRGTPEHLKQFPPQRRRLNLQTTILDVAEQNSGASVMNECHQVMLTSDEVEGVHYLWWIAAPRRFFEMKDGKPVPRPEAGVKLESEPGRVRIPLSAYYRDSRLRAKQETTQVELAIPQGTPRRTLVEIAGRARRDAMMVEEGLRLYGGIEHDTVRLLAPNSVTDESYAAELQSQLNWLRSYDRLTGETLSGPQ